MEGAWSSVIGHRFFLTMRAGIAFLLVLTLLTGCSSSRQVVQPEYKEKLSGRPTLGVLPLGADLMEGEASETPTPLTQRGRSLFYRLFGLALSDLSYLTVIEAGHDYRPDSVTFAYRRLGLSASDSVEVPVPVDGPVSLDDRNPAFLLLIDDLTIGYGTDEGREALGTLVTEQLIVTARCEYVLWDNRAHRVVGYGRLRETAPTEPGANVHGPISVLFQRLGLAIIRKSPFVVIGEGGSV